MSESDLASDSPPLSVEVTEDPDDAAVGRAKSGLLHHPAIEALFPGADLWVARLDIDDKGPRGATFSAVIQDADTGRLATASGRLDDPARAVVRASANHPPPTEEEHAWAAATLLADRRLPPLVDGRTPELYRPMPPLASIRKADGSVERVIAVGVRVPRDNGSDPGSDAVHHIVGVRSGDGEIFEQPAVDQSAGECGPPASTDGPGVTGPRRARVRVTRGDDVLWELVVVRPSASSGTNGSGVELRAVDYLGQRVLHRAHVPIVNFVLEGGEGRPGATYRSWLSEEACFEVEGEDAVPGFRVTPATVGTVLDGAADGGGFRGVALQVDGDELVVSSVLGAGWLRYLSEWRLAADGTIRPSLTVGAVRNPISCLPHAHQAYWRFDFDILTADDNLVQEHNEPPVEGATHNWHTVRFEVRRTRDDARRRAWRVRHRRSGMGYAVNAGSDDGVAGSADPGSSDPSAVGDVWVLAHRRNEIDDGKGITAGPEDPGGGPAAAVDLDRFLTGDPVHGHDVVFWYAGQARSPGTPRGGEGGSEDVSRMGPVLVPFNWRALAQREPFDPLTPPEA